MIADPEEVLARLSSGEVDPREIVLFEQDPPVLLTGGRHPEAEPQIVSYTPNRVVIHQMS